MTAPAPAPVVKFDSRGRITLRNLIERNGIAAAVAYTVGYGPNQTLTLTPLKVAA